MSFHGRLARFLDHVRRESELSDDSVCRELARQGRMIQRYEGAWHLTGVGAQVMHAIEYEVYRTDTTPDADQVRYWKALYEGEYKNAARLRARLVAAEVLST